MCGTLVWAAKRYPGPVSVPLFVLSGLLGASLGWVIGILASPYDVTEESAFGKFGTLIYGFLTGYVVSKFDPLLQKAINVYGAARRRGGCMATCHEGYSCGACSLRSKRWKLLSANGRRRAQKILKSLCA
jgi:hypothetical protein